MPAVTVVLWAHAALFCWSETGRAETWVLVGDTLAEREQTYGFLESRYRAANPETSFRLRNLGWSGDTVTGLSRCYFDPPAVGYKRLVDEIKAVPFDRLILCYGAVDSEVGQAGVSAFERNLEQLLADVAAGPRPVVLVAPLQVPRSKKRWPTAVVEQTNAQRRLYAAALARVAQRQASRQFVDLNLTLARHPVGDLSDDGVALHETGYWHWSSDLLAALQVTRPTVPSVSWNLSGDELTATGGKAALVTSSGSPSERRISLVPAALPWPSAPAQDPVVKLAIKGLSAGRHAVLINEALVGMFDKNQLLAAPTIPVPAWGKAWRQLVATVREKDRLFFDAYRPVNITYLLGFRQYEQGQNAKDLTRLRQLGDRHNTRLDQAPANWAITISVRPAAN